MKKQIERDIEIIKMYNDGKTYKEISDYFGFNYINSSITRNALKRHELNFINQRLHMNNIDLNFFKKINTKEKAYALGLIYSDGSIDKNGYAFSFVSKDYDQVYLFKSLLKSEHKICEIKSFDKKTEKIYVRYTIHICSKEMTKDLLNLGLHNSKSFSCNFPEIDNRFIWHFIRGLFDGDGCISIMNKKDGKLAFSLILSGELKDKIKKIFNDIELNDTKDKIMYKNKDGVISSIKYTAYKDVKKIYDLIYEDSNELRLSRKYLIFSTLKEYKRGIYKRKLKTIYQYDLDMNLINKYLNIHNVPFCKSKIYNSIKTGKKYKDFFFSYELR